MSGSLSVASDVLAVLVRLIGWPLQHAFAALSAAQPLWLSVAVASFAVALVCSAFAWRSVFCARGGSISRVEASARYGIGSLVNSLLPGNAGGACRVLLFARVLPGDQCLWAASSIPAAVGAARAALLAVLVLAAAGSGALPAWAALLPGAIACTAAAACIWARYRAPRARWLSQLLEVFGSLGRSPRGALRLLGWLAASIAASVLAVAAVLASLGLGAPLSTALVIVPALAVATLVSVFPAGIGMGTGAVAFVLHQRGVDPTTAFTAGLVLNSVETVAGLGTGLASALVLGLPAPAARRRALVAAAGCACVVAAALGVMNFADIA
jgi:uncharacterized membrane protein YbhN (UPF0104 family)